MTTGLIRAVRPKISPMLAILLPTMFPTAMSLEPSMTATRQTMNSGMEVPRATTVNPAKKAPMPVNFASPDAPLTRKSAPFQRINKLAIKISRFEISIRSEAGFSPHTAGQKDFQEP